MHLLKLRRVALSAAVIMSLWSPDFVCVLNAQTPVFAISPWARNWLHYFTLTVPYDSSITDYLFGEVKLNKPTGWKSINISEALPYDSVLKSGPARGYNWELAQYAKTDSFSYPIGSTLSFLRILRNTNLGYTYTDVDSVSRQRLGWHITDTAYVRVLLVLASNDSVVATLDSVGTFAKTSYLAGDTRFGPLVHNAFPNVPLPAQNAGTPVYVKLLLEWYGFDPNCDPQSAQGNLLRRFPYSMTISSTVDSTGLTSATLGDIGQWSYERFSQLLSYEDSVKSSTGCLELPFPVAIDSQEQFQRLVQHYGFLVDTSLGTTVYRDTVCEQELGLGKQHGARWHDFPQGEPQSSPINESLTLVRTWVEGNVVNAQVYSESSVEQVSIALIESSGRSVGPAWNGTLRNGTNLVRVRMPSVASTAYKLVVMGKSGKILGSTWITIMK
jgi:hypothetical protein